NIRNGYRVRLYYNDDKVFELAHREFEKIRIYIYNQDKPEETPRLPDTGRKPEDFVPEGWKIVDHVELDFNADGIMDYMGVLEIDSPECRDYHRILFAITSNGTDKYYLDFQNSDLVQQGTVHENEYLPLTAQGTSFTTHLHDCDCASCEYTYTYREGVWWLTSSESTSSYPVICYRKNEWKSGVGIRKWRSSAFSNEAENVDKTDYDVVYELTLDEPLTLEQAGKHKLSAAHRVKDWKVASITFAAGVELPENMVDFPNEGDIDYCDENCVLYTFSDRDEDFDYLVLYRWQDKVLSVLAKEESRIGRSELYKGKIYYSIRIEGFVTYKTNWNEEQITQEKDTIGFKLIRMNLDGTEKETIFEYRYQKAEQEIMEKNWGRYMVGWGYEISGDEIFIQIYLESEYPALFYRMKTDGSRLRMIYT
ncbi:MAG: DUF5050 domain-containing protein, partial [Lachnospiraceae bacterium]|nr:DUF5050 domain-containing protein [Lachnospiraceae bacterium]